MSFQQIRKVGGPITTALHAAIAKRKELLAQGTPEVEVDELIGQDLKAALKNRRDEPWHFTCDKCHDTGWIEVKPTYWEQMRLVRLYGPNPQTQPYYVKCDPCQYIEKQRRERRQRGDVEEDGLEQAAQTKRRR